MDQVQHDDDRQWDPEKPEQDAAHDIILRTLSSLPILIGQADQHGIP
jgi:hypothetical protein